MMKLIQEYNTHVGGLDLLTSTSPSTKYVWFLIAFFNKYFVRVVRTSTTFFNYYNC